jgi:hypothetical protein
VKFDGTGSGDCAADFAAWSFEAVDVEELSLCAKTNEEKKSKLKINTEIRRMGETSNRDSTAEDQKKSRTGNYPLAANPVNCKNNRLQRLITASIGVLSAEADSDQ